MYICIFLESQHCTPMSWTCCQFSYPNTKRLTEELSGAGFAVECLQLSTGLYRKVEEVQSVFEYIVALVLRSFRLQTGSTFNLCTILGGNP
jgi:hypothetical protein